MKLTKKFSIMLTIFCCVSCISAVRAETYEVVRWLDGFESHTCGDYLSSWTGHETYSDIPGSICPLSLWNVGGNDEFYTVIDCTKAFGGTQSVQQAWNGSDALNRGSIIIAYPNYYTSGTQIMIRPGCTTVAEMDAYFIYDAGNTLNDGEGQAVLTWHSTGGGVPVAGWYVFVDGGPTSKVRYLVGPGFADYADSTMPMLTGNRWYHFRTEIYDDFTYSVFITPNGQSTQTMISKAACPNAKQNPPYYNSDYLELKLMMAKGIIYWDNVKVSYIANNAQGFRSIYTVPAGVAIDGSLGSTEWSKATKVASKPLGSNGAFNPTYSYNVVIDTNQTMDVYTAYDSSNYYVAARFNRVITNPSPYGGSYFEAIFADEPNGLVYTFCASAMSSSGTTGQLRKFVGKHDMPEYTSYDPCLPGLSWSTFTGAGGQIVYSITGDVMDVEMKIPFSQLAGFPPFGANRKVNLQFNVTGNVYGTASPRSLMACTTNIGFERYPWQNSNNDIGTPFGAGIAYPACGDVDNQYPVGDITGPLGTPDCRVDFRDLALMVDSWLAGL